MCPADFVSNLPMEVPPAFYPPPTVCVPQIEVPPLRQYEYKFDHEKTAILRWEKEKRIGRNEKETERIEQTNNQRQRHTEEKGTESDAEGEAHFSGTREEGGQQRRTKEHGDSLNGLQHQMRESLKIQTNSAPRPDQPPHFSSSLLLRPVPMSSSSPDSSHIGTAPGQNVNTLLKSYTANNTLDGLEEFEPRRDLFDLLELRSLDARKELEKFFDL